MPQDYSQFTKLLSEYLNRIEQSQGWLAKKLGCNASQVNRWLDGIQRPGKNEVIWKMESVLKLSQDELDHLLTAANYPPRYTIQHAPILPNNSSLPDPLMNFKDELAAFEKIATGQDTKTRLILVQGPGGTGKSRLLQEYETVADKNSLDILAIHLEQQIFVEDCLEQIVGRFGREHFTSYTAYWKAGRPEPLTRDKEKDWWRNLTNEFFMDLAHYLEAPRLAIFFDYYEKADPAFKDWLGRIFLPGAFFQESIVIVIAGRDEIQPKPTGSGQHHFYLSGLSVDWFHRYAADCQIYIDPHFINEIHKVLQGRPKFFVEYIRSRLTPRLI